MSDALKNQGHPAASRQREDDGSTVDNGASFASSIRESNLAAHAQGPGSQAHGVVIVNQGLSFTETERLFGLLFEQNFPRLAEAAKAEAQRRVDDLAATFRRVAVMQNITEEQLISFAEPDVQFVLNSAIQASARQKNKERSEVLARLISRRLQSRDSDLESLVLGEAVLAAGKLTTNQLYVLALCFLTMYADWFDGPFTWRAANDYLQSMIMPFIFASVSRGDLLHIEYAGCATMTRGPVQPFDHVIAHRYPALFSAENSAGQSRTVLIRSTIQRESPSLMQLSDLSNRVRFYLLNPTTVGVMLAVAIIEQVTGKRLPIDKWLG